MESDRSHHSQTLSAASHSCSRTNRWRERADWRQSIEFAASPAWYCRNCQKVSPMPVRRRPCTPGTTVAATRSASTRREGSFWLSASAARRSLFCRRPSVAAVSVDMPAETVDDVVHADPFGPGGEGHGHAVAQHRPRQGDHVLERGGEPAVEQRPNADGQHQALAGARAGTPGDLLGEAGQGLVLRPAGTDQAQDQRRPAARRSASGAPAAACPSAWRRRAPAAAWPRAPLVVAMIIRRSASSAG